MKLTSALKTMSTATFVILNWLAQTFCCVDVAPDLHPPHGPVAQDPVGCYVDRSSPQSLPTIW